LFSDLLGVLSAERLITQEDPYTAESAMPVLGERGVVGNLSLESKSAEPAVRQMHTHLFYQASFTGDSVQIAHQQKAQENFRVNRGTANGTVCISQPFSDESEIDEAIEALQEMIIGDLIFQPKIIEQ
jgi:hypothetical protein